MGALTGLRVLDLSRVLGGPFCAQILGDHGAEVIKVEPPAGDETRTWGPPFDEVDLSAYFNGANRNKQSIALDLSVAEGREVLLRLLNKTDILVENFKPGTLEGWGIGFDSVLREKFPRLIHCQITGFGGIGPLGQMPGYDAAAQAWTGLMSINGNPSEPTRMGLPIIDLAAGMNACIGILSAVYERERSGLGQSVATSLFESGLSLLHPHGANFLMSGKSPKSTGSRHSNICPYDLFSTKSTPIFLAVGNNTQFEKLCRHLGAELLSRDLRFIDNKTRLKNSDALKLELEKSLKNFDGRTLAEDLMKIGVPAGPVLTINESFAHPQAAALGSRVEVDGVSYIAPPVRLSRTKASVRTKTEHFAVSREKILARAGFTPAEIKNLESTGVTPVKPQS